MARESNGMDRCIRWVLPALAVVAMIGIASPAWAQDPNQCDVPGEAPDVIVGDLPAINYYGTSGGISAYSVATTSCNVGTCWLKWISSTNEHPVIGQNMYRLKDDRLEQIGQSWLKHGFFALSNELCDTGCVSTNGTHLGVNCSDPYSAGLNGDQSRLGPRSEVNPTTGDFLYPFTTIGQTGNAIYKRLQVHNDDLDPALNAGAIYFVEGQYITSDDAAAGNASNNASYREVTVNESTPGVYNLDFAGATQRRIAAAEAWSDFDPEVKAIRGSTPGDGEFIVAGRPIPQPNGDWRFSYAVQNFDSNRAGQAFRVPVPAGATVSNIGFHDVDYHSGEPYDSTDWVGVHDTAINQVVWSTDTFDVNANANALRWGTTYSFWFDVDTTPTFGPVFLDYFLPGTPTEISITATAPRICNLNDVCEAGETCSNCPQDCVNAGPVVGFCGDGICEPGLGENCTNCADCRGIQSGNPDNRFCCGDGGGDTPVGCNDNRCTTSGFQCGSTATQTCCGDTVCEPGEDSCVCAADCGLPPVVESVCGDTIDEDCDGQTDCADLDCCTDGICADGIDADADGVAECDCDDNDGSIWDTPGPVSGVTVDHDLASGTTLTWTSPAAPGALNFAYEALRTPAADDFNGLAACVTPADPTAPMLLELEDPPIRNLFYYLIRAVNACPAGDGDVGQDSSGSDRPARTCP